MENIVPSLSSLYSYTLEKYDSNKNLEQVCVMGRFGHEQFLFSFSFYFLTL